MCTEHKIFKFLLQDKRIIENNYRSDLLLLKIITKLGCNKSTIHYGIYKMEDLSI